MSRLGRGGPLDTSHQSSDHITEGTVMASDSHEEKVAERARENGYILIPHGGEYVLVDLADDFSWSIYDTLAAVEEILADLD
jgi:hypothetical protein